MDESCHPAIIFLTGKGSVGFDRIPGGGIIPKSFYGVDPGGGIIPKSFYGVDPDGGIIPKPFYRVDLGG